MEINVYLSCKTQTSSILTPTSIYRQLKPQKIAETNSTLSFYPNEKLHKQKNPPFQRLLIMCFTSSEPNESFRGNKKKILSNFFFVITI